MTYTDAEIITSTTGTWYAFALHAASGTFDQHTRAFMTTSLFQKRNDIKERAGRGQKVWLIARKYGITKEEVLRYLRIR